MIKVSDLHKSFGKLEVLKGIDENIEKGEKIVVIGPPAPARAPFAVPEFAGNSHLRSNLV